MHSVRPFGLLLSLPDTKRHGLVYHTQVSEGIAFDRNDDDDSKVKAPQLLLPSGQRGAHINQHSTAQPCCPAQAPAKLMRNWRVRS